jgi:DNA-binding MarR family transcriptional regulator
LLLLLLNAAYQKPPVGRLPGWPFGVLQARIKVSERCLRKLLADAIAEGIVERRYGQLDRRRIVYSLTPRILQCWNNIFCALLSTLPDALQNLSQNELADIDYSVWNPERPAREQFPRRAVYLYLKSAVDPDAGQIAGAGHTVKPRGAPFGS